MIVLVDPNDSRAVRNKDNVLALYDLMINQKKSEEGTAKLVSPVYIQHNPLIPDGPIRREAAGASVQFLQSACFFHHPPYSLESAATSPRAL